MGIDGYLWYLTTLDTNKHRIKSNKSILFRFDKIDL